MAKRVVFLTLTLMWMMLIFYFSAQNADVSGNDSTNLTVKIIGIFTNNPSDKLINCFETVIRKIAHFTEYAILAILVCFSLHSFGVSLKKSALSIAICAVYALSDELHQYFVPGRACRLLDIFIDTLGATFGYYFLKITLFLKNKIWQKI